MSNQYELTSVVNVSEEEFAKWFVENEAMIYEGSPLAEGAKFVLTTWENEHELFFISARGSHLLDNTKKWFIRQGINLSSTLN